MIVFDPRKFDLTVFGVPISGFGSGDFFKAVRRKPLAALEELGADGEAAFVLSGDHSYDIEITLKKSSPSNTWLSQCAAATAASVPTIGEVSAIDRSTGAEFNGPECIVIMSPEFVRSGGEKLGENVWKIACKKGTETQPGDAT